MISKPARREYDAITAHNYSSLKRLLTSALAYHHAALAAFEPTAAMRLGSATHCAVLEPTRYAAEYAVWSGDRRGKAYDAFLDEHPGMNVINAAEHHAIDAMSRAVRAHPDARAMLPDERVAELTMTWLDGNHICKARADWIDQASHVVGGLKTTRDPSPTAFSRQAFALHYDLQWAYYHRGYQSNTGTAPKMIEIAVQNVAPWDVAVYVISDAMLAVGRDKLARCWALLDECMRADTWPGCAPTTMVLEPCDWALSRVAAVDLDFGGIE